MTFVSIVTLNFSPPTLKNLLVSGYVYLLTLTVISDASTDVVLTYFLETMMKMTDDCCVSRLCDGDLDRCLHDLE